MLIALNKPYGVLCQFTDPEGRPTLADHVKEPDVYAAGRLDSDSEGLLLLTDDGPLVTRLSDPKSGTLKRYLAQVEGEVTEEALDRLREGVELKDGMTLPADAFLSAEPDWLWPRDPPIRHRLNVPTSWIELGLREDRNRQVRRMTAAVGFPTLRLIRIAIGGQELAGLQPGEMRMIDPARRRPVRDPNAPRPEIDRRRPVIENARTRQGPRSADAPRRAAPTRPGRFGEAARGTGAARPGGGFDRPRAPRDAAPTRSLRAAGPVRQDRDAAPSRSPRSGAPSRSLREGSPARPSRGAVPARPGRDGIASRPSRGASPSRPGAGPGPRRSPGKPAPRGRR